MEGQESEPRPVQQARHVQGLQPVLADTEGGGRGRVHHEG